VSARRRHSQQLWSEQLSRYSKTPGRPAAGESEIAPLTTARDTSGLGCVADRAGAANGADHERQRAAHAYQAGPAVLNKPAAFTGCCLSGSPKRSGRLGCPVRFTLTAGQKGDAPQAAALIEGLPAEVVMADTAYDADHLRQAIAAKGAIAVIPNNPSRASFPLGRSHRNPL
jgi:hypothetical protein